MGSSTSKPTPETQHILEQANINVDSVSPQQLQRIENLPPSQKQQVLRELQHLNTTTEQQIKLAKQHAESQQVNLSHQTASVEKQAETNVARITAQKQKQAKAIINKHVSKTKKSATKSICSEWKDAKKENKQKPKNPLTNTRIKGRGPTAKTLNAICRNKTKVCANPNVSLKTNKPYSEKSTRRHLLNRICEN